MVDEKQKELGKTSRKGLKMMQKNRSKNVVRKGTRIVKYGAKGFGRNIWLSTAATIVMILTLVILFATIVTSAILSNTAQTMKDKIDITIYFEPETSSETLAKLEEKIKQDPNIKSVQVSSSKEEYEKVKDFYTSKKDEGEDTMDWDEIKDSMTAKLSSLMRIKVYDIDNLDSIKEIVENDELFIKNRDKRDGKEPTYDTNRLEIDTITSWARIARMGGLILAVVFLTISILIIFSTIRMAIFSRREEIYMMKLVGADKSFIRGPFLVEAEICGIIAGLVAGGLSYAALQALTPMLLGWQIDVGQISTLINDNIILMFLIFILLGVFIGWLSARLAVSKYLRKT